MNSNFPDPFITVWHVLLQISWRRNFFTLLLCSWFSLILGKPFPVSLFPLPSPAYQSVAFALANCDISSAVTTFESTYFVILRLGLILY